MSAMDRKFFLTLLAIVLLVLLCLACVVLLLARNNIWSAVIAAINGTVGVISSILQYHHALATTSLRPQKDLILTNPNLIPNQQKPPKTNVRVRWFQWLLSALLIGSIAGNVFSGFTIFSQQPSFHSPAGPPILADPLTAQTSNFWESYNHGSYSCQFAHQHYETTIALRNHMTHCVYQGSSFSDFFYQVDMTVIKGDHSNSGAGYAAFSLLLDTDGSTIPGYHLQNN
jgi:hypothetical protein